MGGDDTDMSEELHDEAVRGADAQSILDNVMVREALTEMETSVIDKIASCPPENEKLQQKLCMMLGVVRTFRQIFITHIQTGKLAMESLTQDGKKRKFGIF